MDKKNKYDSIKNELTLRNKGVFIAILIVEIVFFVKGVLKNPKKDALTTFFHSTMTPIEFHFGLIFVFMSPTILAIQRKTSNDIISRLIRPRSPGMNWLRGWRTIRLENTVSLHIYVACWFLFWSILHVALGLFMYYLAIYDSPKDPSVVAGSLKSSFLPHEKDFFSMFEKYTLYISKGANQYMLVTGFILTFVFIIISGNSIRK
ncbi:hypothetical protein AYI69_g5786 [Smittium culicis]|uniref:Ferric oxidoreductase domain-containing protein n=1 Tax=Smittium culicis TaxID=133412 RepID=A0A1R1Y3J4_9FUNG|nr:hypothetical protein AYI69_g5786 [Smittium culicis]